MNYIEYKDNSPEKTIKNIKETIEKLNIKIVEKYCNRQQDTDDVVSVEIALENIPEISVRGKGINKINALASGYGEFIERIQTHQLIDFSGDSYFFEPDEIICNYKNLENNVFAGEIENKNLFPELIKLINKYNKIQKVKNPYLIQKDLEESKVVMAPFFSVRTRKCIYLPSQILIKRIQFSNGAASGNTFEEAIVQGLSEICERYSLKTIFKQKLSIPEIPEELYLKYDSLNKLISYIRAQGYKITVKDASLGKEIPVICTIFEDIKFPENGVIIKFAAHPSFPVAVERSLTEFLQGDISDLNMRYKRKYLKNKNESNIDAIINDNYRTSINFDYKAECIQNLITNKKSNYIFNEKVWVFDNNQNNKTLLNLLCNKILKFSGDIYIRNYSFLNHPTVYIYIPQMSYCVLYDRTIIENELNLINWVEFSHKKQNKEYIFSVENLCKACEYYNQRIFKDMRLNISSVSSIYLLLLCFILCNDENGIKKYLEERINELFIRDVISNNTQVYRFYLCLQKYLNMKINNIREEDIIVQLRNEYSENEIQNLNKFFKNLSFENIKKSIQKYPHYIIDIKDKAKVEKLKELSKKLYYLYGKNTPNQQELLYLFQ